MIKLSGLSIEQTYEIIPKNTILLGFVGSLAHGTYIPKEDPNSIDDKDILGICVANENAYFGLERFEQKEKKQGEWDSVVYEIRKAFHLLLKQNPNILGLLWLQEKDYIHISESGKMILENRNLFVSKEAYHSFVGYAHGQLHRMTHGAFDGYMGAKRKQLVEKFGHDTKNAAHLIRLLRMGIEYLTDGTLRVFREDAAQLKEIKTGGWSLERVKEEADRLFILAQEAYVRSTLPAFPDKEKAEKLLIEILKKELLETLYDKENTKDGLIVRPLRKTFHQDELIESEGYKINMVVECIENSLVIKIGYTGTIVCFLRKGIVGVMWDNFTRGHDLNGRVGDICINNQGYYIPTSCIRKLY